MFLKAFQTEIYTTDGIYPSMTKNDVVVMDNTYEIITNKTKIKCSIKITFTLDIIRTGLNVLFSRYIN